MTLLNKSLYFSCFLRERELQYVDSVNTTIREGWITLNVSSPLQHWVNNPKENRGFYLSVHPSDRSGKFLFTF